MKSLPALVRAVIFNIDGLMFNSLSSGDHVLAVAPPFIITREQIDTLVRVLDGSITVVEEGLGLRRRRVI